MVTRPLVGIAALGSLYRDRRSGEAACGEGQARDSRAGHPDAAADAQQSAAADPSRLAAPAGRRDPLPWSAPPGRRLSEQLPRQAWSQERAQPLASHEPLEQARPAPSPPSRRPRAKHCGAEQPEPELLVLRHELRSGSGRCGTCSVGDASPLMGTRSSSLPRRCCAGTGGSSPAGGCTRTDRRVGRHQARGARVDPATRAREQSLALRPSADGQRSAATSWRASSTARSCSRRPSSSPYEPPA
jgi:hypothetical protein